MKKVELRLVGLSYNQTQQGSYILVLGEVGTTMKLPIIIKPSHAQYIALKIENLKTPLAQTHDLFKKLTDFYSIDLQEVFITNILEGVYYVKLIFTNMVDECEIDTTIGDAISLALDYKCPIFCTKEVLDISGIQMLDDGSLTDEQYEENHKDRDYGNGVTVENLEKMLDKALENEEYEIAGQLRDRINELKNEL